MPLPLNITWLQVSTGVDTLEIRDSESRRAYTIPLVNHHAEILARPTLGNGPAGYLLKRSTFIQERLFDLYISVIRSGISNIGCFYGVIQYQGVWHELDTIQFEGRIVYLTNNPEPHIYHRIGLLYTTNPIPIEGLELEPQLIGEFGLPTSVMATLQDRSAHDYLVDQDIFDPVDPDIPEVPLVQPTQLVQPQVTTRRSRYLREPVI